MPLLTTLFTFILTLFKLTVFLKDSSILRVLLALWISRNRIASQGSPNPMLHFNALAIEKIKHGPASQKLYYWKDYSSLDRSKVFNLAIILPILTYLERENVNQEHRYLIFYVQSSNENWKANYEFVEAIQFDLFEWVLILFAISFKGESLLFSQYFPFLSCEKDDHSDKECEHCNIN